MKSDQPSFAPVLRRVSGRDGAMSVNAQVARSLGIAIISGDFAVDEKLPREPELLEQYGISRTVLREALKVLSAKGLIASRTNVGTWVLDRSHWQVFDADVLAWHAEKGIDAALLDDIFEFRLAIEPAGAAMAARRATQADIVELTNSTAAMRAALADVQAFGEADLVLHRALGRLSGNLLMRGSGSVIETSLVAVYAAIAAATGAAPDAAALATSLALHEAIVEAIAEGDSVAASAAMTAVVEFERAAIFAGR